MFRFKQFNVDQSGCAMKINTDGVLLGAITTADNPATILDIGTGTGVIALMLVQRFIYAQIDAVEIDGEAAKTAERNFAGSPFADRLVVYHAGYENYFDQFPEKKYDLIVSNPPFYISSLKSPGAKKALAKHTGIEFFEKLISGISNHLAPGGVCWLILPVNIAKVITPLASAKGTFPAKLFNVRSYPESLSHRTILCLDFTEKTAEITNVTIYQAKDIYSEEYKKLLQSYFINF